MFGKLGDSTSRPRRRGPLPSSALGAAGVALALAVGGPAAAGAASGGSRPDPQASHPPAPERLSDARKEEFLRSARIVGSETLTVGITGARRATLSDGRLTHDAHVQTVDLSTRRIQRRSRRVVKLRDSFELNIAAYRLDRLLGLGIVPVSVERSIDGRRAAFTWWVDDVLMMESDRVATGTEPPESARWQNQMHRARVFNQLVFNTDPNLANLLITADWRLRMVDFTRAFRPYRRLPDPAQIECIDRAFYRGLRDLGRKELERRTKGYLTFPEVDAVMLRRDQILDLFELRLAERGESAVFCDLPRQ